MDCNIYVNGRLFVKTVDKYLQDEINSLEADGWEVECVRKKGGSVFINVPEDFWTGRRPLCMLCSGTGEGGREDGVCRACGGSGESECK